MVVSIALTGGCTSYSNSRTVAKVGGFTLVASLPTGIGVAAVMPKEGDGYNAAVSGAVVFLGMLVTGGLLGSSGLIGMVVHVKPPSDAQRRQAEAPAREIQVEEAAARERHEQCLESRVSQLRNAGRITDAQARARALQSIPPCAAPDTGPKEPPFVAPVEP